MAQFVLGEMYARGEGVTTNLPLGKRYLELSAGKVRYKLLATSLTMFRPLLTE